MANEYLDSVDSAEATTQPDIFNPTARASRSVAATPSRRPAATGPASARRSGGTSLRRARAGSRSRRTAASTSSSPSTHGARDVADHAHRAVPERRRRLGGRRDPQCPEGDQLHGAGRRRRQHGRAAEHGATWFPDRDADGVFDALEECDLRGMSASAAARPSCALRHASATTTSPGASGSTSLALDDVPEGRAGRGPLRALRTQGHPAALTRTGVLKLSGFVGRTVRGRRPDRDLASTSGPDRQGHLPLRRRRQVLPLADHGRGGPRSTAFSSVGQPGCVKPTKC